MPWTIVPAELVGTAVGSILGNEAASKVKEIIEKNIDDKILKIIIKPLAVAVAAGLIHGISAYLTKIAINLLGLDPVGAATTHATTPVTSGAHAIYQFLDVLAQELIKAGASKGSVELINELKNEAKKKE